MAGLPSPVIHAHRRCFEHSQLRYAMGTGEGAVHSSTHSGPVFPAALEETFFSPLYVFASFVKDKVP